MTPGGKLRIPLVGTEARPTIVRGDPDDFYAAVAEAYAQAEAAAGRVQRDYVIAEQRVRLCFAGPALEPLLTPALAHLAAPAGDAPPDLTIHLWDMASTGSAAPPPAWDYADFHPNSQIDGFDRERYDVAFELGSNALSLVSYADDHAYYWVKQAAQVPHYDQSAPLRVILHHWLSRRGIHRLHAGAVGRPAGGVLLVGRSGSGKSNTALTMLNSDLRYASDDYCLLALEPQPTAYSLYCTGKTHAADLDRLPFLRAAVRNGDQLASQKAVYSLHTHFPHKLIGSFPVRAVVQPRVAAQDHTTLRRLTAAQGLAGLAPSTLALWPGLQAGDFRALVALARQVPSYALEVGRDQAHLIATLTALVDALNAGAPPA